MIFFPAILLNLLYAENLSSQQLSVILDTSLGSGMQLSSHEKDTMLGKTPFFLNLDTGFVFNEDFSTEWTMQLMLPLEGIVALGINPQVRLVKSDKKVTFFASGGVPLFLQPFTLYGIEIGGGSVYYLYEKFGFTFRGAIDVFVAGSDLPSNSVLLQFNLSLGMRVIF